MQYLGNKEILKQHKIAFLCSRRCPAHIILKSYDWAIEQREKGNCIISGFHSQIEKDVFHYLLKGKQPIILALARGIKKRFEPEIEEAIAENRLLIITPFNENVKRITVDTATKRNELMVETADEIFIAYASMGGNLDQLIKSNNKPVSTFEGLLNPGLSLSTGIF